MSWVDWLLRDEKRQYIAATLFIIALLCLVTAIAYW
jgi:hypothetical protein